MRVNGTDVVDAGSVVVGIISDVVVSTLVVVGRTPLAVDGISVVDVGGAVVVLTVLADGAVVVSSVEDALVDSNVAFSYRGKEPDLPSETVVAPHTVWYE